MNWYMIKKNGNCQNNVRTFITIKINTMITQSKTLDMTISGIGETLSELIELSQNGKANETDLKNMAILSDTINNLKFFNPTLFK